MLAGDAIGSHSSVGAVDPEITLLTPAQDEHEPLVSIVVPALNERATIREFITWCHEGLARADIPGEIIIVDSSTDETPTLAVEAGARVLRTPRRGLGRAYIDAIPFIRGRYVIMGDADCTYDFREIDRFVAALDLGHDFAMGSRWRGTIEAGSMPALHRFVGTPVTTWILNQLYSSHFSDIHCGMRAITKDALLRMGLSSQSWEYASEMVLKSVRMGLDITEVPVSFYKDRTGRVSHHKRAGWLSPFKAAWINLRAMFVYGAEYFMLKPGLVLFILGLLMTMPLSFGPISIGSVTFSLYWMLVGVALAVMGLECFFFGCLAQWFCSYSDLPRSRLLRRFPYTRTVSLSIGLSVLGVVPLAILAIRYFSDRFSMPPASSLLDHLAVTGLLASIVGFSTFCFTLVVHATSVRYGLRVEDDHMSEAASVIQG